MKLSIKNPFVWYFHQCYGLYPKNICSLFWLSLFAFVMSIVTIPGMIINWIAKNRDDNAFGPGFWLWLVNGVFMLVGSGFTKSIWWAWLIGLGFLAAVAILIVIVVLICIYVKERTEKKRAMRVVSNEPVEEETFYIRDTWAAITNKYCTKIEIIDEP